MTLLSHTEIEELASKIGFPCISLYMPGEKTGAETRKNSIRFKNLLSKAETKLEELGNNSDFAKSWKFASSYIENHDFWQHQKSGLAFFISQEEVEYYRLDCNFEEMAIVGDRFYLQPLLPIVNQNTKFYLLALSQNQIKLFSGNRDRLTQLELPKDVPLSLAEALKYDDPEKQTQYHSGDSDNSPIYLGQGVGTKDNKDEISRFFHQINNGIESAFNAEQVSLILAGVEYLLPIYHEANSYSNLLEKGIAGNPENVTSEKLHQQAWAIIEERLETDKQQQVERYGQMATQKETSDRFEDIVAAAASGQIDTLFLVPNSQTWGSYVLQSNKVEIHQEQQQNSVDLVDFVAVNTYLKGGKVYTIDSDQMSSDSKMTAILRYPIYAEAAKATV